MLELLADENFNKDIVRGLLQRAPEIDIIRAQDIGLDDTDDPIILGWAAQHRRVLLSHDRNTMIGYAFQRVETGEPMPGLIIVKQTAPVSEAIEDLLILILCSSEGELNRQVVYIPF
jgi:hypothetical protein